MTDDEKKILEKKWKFFKRRRFKNAPIITYEMLEEARIEFMKKYVNRNIQAK